MGDGWEEAKKIYDEEEGLSVKKVASAVGHGASRALGGVVGAANAPLAALWGSLTPYENEYEEEEFNKLSLPEKMAVRVGSGFQSAIDSFTKEGSFGKGYAAHYKSQTGEDINPAIAAAVEMVSDPLIVGGLAKGLAKAGMRTLPELYKYLKTGRTPIEKMVTPAVEGQMAGRVLAEQSEIIQDVKRTIADEKWVEAKAKYDAEMMLPRKKEGGATTIPPEGIKSTAVDEIGVSGQKTGIPEEGLGKETTIPEKVMASEGADMAAEGAGRGKVTTPVIDDASKVADDIIEEGGLKSAKRAKDLNEALARMGIEKLPDSELAKYPTVTWDGLRMEVAAYMNSVDEDTLYKAALGEVESGLSAPAKQVLRNAAQAKAESTGNVEMIQRFIKDNTTTARTSILGQELGAAGVDKVKNSIIDDLTDVAKVRGEIAKKQGKKITDNSTQIESTTKELDDIDKAISNKRSSLERQVKAAETALENAMAGLRKGGLGDRKLWSPEIGQLEGRLMGLKKQLSDFNKALDDMNPELAAVKYAKQQSKILDDIHKLDKAISDAKNKLLKEVPRNDTTKQKEVYGGLQKLLDRKKAKQQELNSLVNDRDEYLIRQKQLEKSIKGKKESIFKWGRDKEPKRSDLWNEAIGELSREDDVLGRILKGLRDEHTARDPESLSIAISKRYGIIRDKKRSVENKIVESKKRIAENRPEEATKQKSVPHERLRESVEELNALNKELRDLHRLEKKILHPTKTKAEQALSRLRKSYEKQITRNTEKMEKLDLSKDVRFKTILDDDTRKLLEDKITTTRNLKALQDANIPVTKKEVTTLVGLSDRMKQLKTKWVDDPDAPHHGFPSLMDRLKYGNAKREYNEYLNFLKQGDMSLSELFQRRIGEFRETAKTIDKNQAFRDLGKDFITELSNSTIAMVASLDDSFIGRQGLATLFSHPTIWANAFVQSIGDISLGLRKKEGAARAETLLMNEVYSRRNFMNGLYEKANLIQSFEEQYPTTLPERIPGFGRLFTASEKTFLNAGTRMRLNTFDLLLKQAEKAKVPIDDVLIQDLGKLINSVTGRADVNVPKHIRLLLWAPKMMAANINFLTMHKVGVFGGRLKTSFARQEATKNLVLMVSGVAGAAALVNAIKPGSVEVDPRSSDFMKIRIGDTRIDLTGGRGQYVVFIARILATMLEAFTPINMGGSIKNAQTKILSGLNTGEFGVKEVQNIGLDFLMNKTTPLVGAFRDVVLRGRTFEGEKPTPARVAATMMTPIYLKNMIDNMLGDYKATDEDAAIFAGLLDFFGINANTYRPLQHWDRSKAEWANELREDTTDKEFNEMNVKYNTEVNKEIDRIVKKKWYNELSNEDKDKEIKRIKREIKQDITGY